MNFSQGLGIGLVVGFLISGAILLPYIIKIKRESEDTYSYYQIYSKVLIEKIHKLGGEI